MGKINAIGNRSIIDEIETGKYSTVGHGANCFHTMGAGVARVLNDYTEGKLLRVDKTTKFGNINKLGCYSNFTMEGIEYYNLYTQFTFGNDRDIVYVHWPSVGRAIGGMVDSMQGKNILLPLIGCGLANGRVETLVEVIKYNINPYKVNVTLVTNENLPFPLTSRIYK